MAANPALDQLLIFVTAFVVAWGLLLVYRYLLSPFMMALAAALDSVVIPLPFHHVHPLRFAAKVVRAADASMLHWLGQAVLKTQGAIITVWHGLANQVEALGKFFGEMANTIEHVATHIVRVQIPAAIHHGETYTNRHVSALRSAITHDLGRLEHTLTHDYNRLRQFTEAELAKFARGIDRLHHEFTRELSKGIDFLQHEISATRARADRIANDVAHVVGRVGKLERELTGVRGRLSTLEKAFGIAGVTALVAAALARLGLSWTRCNQVGRVGRNVCGMDPRLLESILLDVAALAGTMSLVEFAREMQGVVSETERGIRHFWQAD